MKTTRTFWSVLTMLIVASMLLAACGSGAAPEEPAPAEEMAKVDFPVMSGGALEEALKGTYKGTTVTVDGAMEGNDPDGVKFSEGMKAFEDATGIDVNYIGNKEFEATISVRVDAGDAPDIADFPQPGKVTQYVQKGVVVDVTSFMSEEWLSQQYNQSWRDMATVGGMEAGVFHRFNGKSLVWYPKNAWDAAAYEIP
jgi:alpha-glucoside transport system substrate-binding protein